MDARDTHTEAGANLTGLGWLLGWLFGVVGVLLVSAGVLYAAMGWVYGTVVAIWTAEWGLPLFGVGLGLSRFGRRGTGIVAVATGLVASTLIVLGRISHEYDSHVVTLLIDGAAVLIGIASMIHRLRRSRAREVPAHTGGGHRDHKRVVRCCSRG